MAADEQTQMFAGPGGDRRAVKRDRAYLVVLAGASVGEMYKVEGDKTIIGRGQKAQIRLFDDGISREHAQILIEGEPHHPAGPGLDQRHLLQRPARSISRELVDGDKILVGSTTILKFTYHDKLDEIFQQQMYESALRDGLTKAFNKKYFTDRLESEFTFAIRHASPLALVLFDIDHFKKVNDTHGHPAGDHVLSEISTPAHRRAARRGRVRPLRRRGVRASSAAAPTSTQAQVVGERLRKAVEGHRFVYEGTHIPVTISVGVAVLPNPAVKDANDIVGVRRPGALQIEARRPQPRHCVSRPTSSALRAIVVTAWLGRQQIKRVIAGELFCRTGQRFVVFEGRCRSASALFL